MCNKLPINLQLNESRDSVKFWTSNIDGRSTELTVYYYKVSYSFPHPSPRPKKMEIIFTISRTHCRFNQIWLHNSSAEQLVQLSKQNKNQLLGKLQQKVVESNSPLLHNIFYIANELPRFNHCPKCKPCITGTRALSNNRSKIQMQKWHQIVGKTNGKGWPKHCLCKFLYNSHTMRQLKIIYINKDRNWQFFIYSSLSQNFVRHPWTFSVQ